MTRFRNDGVPRQTIDLWSLILDYDMFTIVFSGQLGEEDS